MNLPHGIVLDTPTDSDQEYVADTRHDATLSKAVTAHGQLYR